MSTPPAPVPSIAVLHHLIVALERQLRQLADDDPLRATLEATLAEVQQRVVDLS